MIPMNGACWGWLLPSKTKLQRMSFYITRNLEVENINGNGNATSAKLINPKLLLDLPARPGPRYNAGPLLVSQNQINTTNIDGVASGSGGATTSNTTVYLMIGDLDHHTTKAETYEDGPPP